MLAVFFQNFEDDPQVPAILVEDLLPMLPPLLPRASSIPARQAPKASQKLRRKKVQIDQVTQVPAVVMQAQLANIKIASRNDVRLSVTAFRSHSTIPLDKNIFSQADIMVNYALVGKKKEERIAAQIGLHFFGSILVYYDWLTICLLCRLQYSWCQNGIFCRAEHSAVPGADARGS